MGSFRRIKKQIANHFNANRYKYLGADSVRLVHSGEDFFCTLLSLIEKAQKRIDLQTYIFEEDETGREVAQSLLQAAARGVEVKVVVDGWGSAPSAKLQSLFCEKGIHFRVFAPLFSYASLWVGRRLHHKIAVIDSQFTLVGGINIANKYRGMGGESPWLDFAILVEGKEIGARVQKICEMIDERLILPKIKIKKSFENPPPKPGKVLVGLRQNDWLRNKNQIARSYIHAIGHAKTSIWIVASYFLPGPKLKRALKKAARRGVNIKIILPGVSDVPLFAKATSYLYNYLHRYNIEIYEWRKSVLHAKIAVVDSKWATIGSFNLNRLSAYASVEFNIDVLNPEFARYIENFLEKQVLLGCVKKEPHASSPLYKRIRERIVYALIRWVLKLLVIFPGFKPQSRQVTYGDYNNKIP
jgi:cardiolipin synthase